MIKDVEPLLKECEETLAELKKIGNMEVACYVQGFINSINKIPEVERGNGEWIPCSERLPEEHGYYIVQTDGSHNAVIDIAEYGVFIRKPEYEYVWEWNKASKILAWMPLPEPYKEEGKRQAEHKEASLPFDLSGWKDEGAGGCQENDIDTDDFINEIGADFNGW